MAVVPHNRLTFGQEEEEAVRAVVASGFWAGGPRVRELEGALAQTLGRAEAACVGSGAAALRLALRAIGTRPGDRVLVPAYSCVALPNAVAAVGAEPVAVDVEPDTWTTDSGAAAAAGPAAAVLAVHTFGAPADVDALGANGTAVVDDAAHGLPDSVPPARATITSFYATKLVGGAEGGAVLADDAAVVDFARAERDYTDRPLSAQRQNDKMNDLEAALALAQLRRLPELLAARAALADRYAQRLAAVPGLRLPPAVPGRVWYRYAVASTDVPATELVRRLREHGVVAERPVTDWRDAAQAAATPGASRAYDEVVSLPLFPTLTHPEQDRVVDALERVL